jgi:hypothetical protein
MTVLSKPVTREVPACIRGVPLIVTLTPDGVSFREKRRRTAFLLPYGVAFIEAVEREVQRRRREKKAARRNAR